MIKVTKLTENTLSKVFTDAFTLASTERFTPHLLKKVVDNIEVTPELQRLAAQVSFSDECKDPTEAFKLALMYNGVVVQYTDPEDATKKVFGAWVPN